MKRLWSLAAPGMFLVATRLGAAGCQPPAVEPASDAGQLPVWSDSDACSRGCNRQRDLRCGDVQGNCVEVCRDVIERHLRDLDPECWADAGSKESMRACGAVACP